MEGASTGGFLGEAGIDVSLSLSSISAVLIASVFGCPASATAEESACCSVISVGAAALSVDSAGLSPSGGAEGTGGILSLGSVMAVDFEPLS